MARIRIIRKFANVLNGIDLSGFHVGDVVDILDSSAHVLIAEGWAERINEPNDFATVLIVEDDDDTRRMLTTWVRAQGYSVVEARDGREGLAALVGYRPAVVILDLRMPRMSGRQFRTAQRRLQDDALASVPIVVVSGMDDAEEQATKLGAAGILHKPVDQSELLSAISDQLRLSRRTVADGSN